MLGLWPISSWPRADVVEVPVVDAVGVGLAESADRVGDGDSDGDSGVVHAAAGRRTAARTAAAIGRFTVPPCM
jgi:hypothetical protein